MGQTTLSWQYDGPNPETFNVYRADSPMDPEMLPTPLATAIDGALREYVDTTVVEGNTYYYRVSALKGSIEKVSPELMHVAESLGDPWAYALRSLLHFEQAGGTTVPVDDVAATTWAGAANASVSTANKHDGEASWYGSSTTDSKINVDGSRQLIPSNQNMFTIEAWIYVEALSTYLGAPIFSQSCSGGNCEQTFHVQPNGALTFYRGSALSGGTITVASPAGAVTLNTWHHAAVSFDGTYFRIFLDGVQVAISAATNNGGWANPGSAQYLGHVLIPGYSQYRGSLKGYIDEFRVTLDARYIEDFTPPTEAFRSDRMPNSYDNDFSVDTTTLPSFVKVWTGSAGTWTVSGGQLTMAGGDQVIVSPQGVYMEDGYVETDCVRADDGGLVLRMSSKRDLYLVVFRDGSAPSNPNTGALYKQVSGAFSQIGTNFSLDAWTRGTPCTFRFEAEGTTLRLKQNGVTKLTATDSAHARGRVGLRNFGSSYQAIYNNLKAGDL